MGSMAGRSSMVVVSDGATKLDIGAGHGGIKLCIGAGGRVTILWPKFELGAIVTMGSSFSLTLVMMHEGIGKGEAVRGGAGGTGGAGGGGIVGSVCLLLQRCPMFFLHLSQG